MMIVPDGPGDVTFEVRGRSEDTGLMLLQRLYVLMFSVSGSEYRGGRPGTDLLALMEGANTPPDVVMNQLLALCRSAALSALDRVDRERIASFSCVSSDGIILATLTLTDGTTVKGVLDNV
jgi:hypothetical protein